MVGVRVLVVAQVFELRAQRRLFVEVDEGEEAQAARRQVDPFIVAPDFIRRRTGCRRGTGRGPRASGSRRGCRRRDTWFFQ